MLLSTGDYSLSAPVRVFLFEDRLEIHSPGPLPNSITLDNVRAAFTWSETQLFSR